MKDLETIHNQTILIQSTNQTAPHLETELEIIEILLNQGNQVYWLQCKTELKNCFYNPKNDSFRCNTCYSKVSNGLKIIRENNTFSNNLHVLNYSDFKDIKDYKSIFKESFDSLEELKSFTYKSYDVGLAAVSSLVSFTRDHQPNLVVYKDFINRGLITGTFMYDVAHEIMSKIKPTFVILFNGRFIENRPLLRVCQHLKIDYATHEKGGRLQTFLFRKNSIPHSIDAINEEMDWLWKNAGEDKHEIGEGFFTKKIKGIEDAWFSFTKEQEQGMLPQSLEENKNKRIITIFNSSLDEYEGLEGFGPYFYKDDNVGIEKICNDLLDVEGIKLYLRIHPNLRGLQNSQAEFINKRIRPLDSVEIIDAEDTVDSYALIRASDIIIVFGSTVGIEAAFMGKKVILLGRAAYEKLSCCYIPKNHEEVIEMLRDENYPFSEINTKEAIKYGYWNETFGLPHINYEPIGFNKGKYRGKFLKANFITRKLKQIFEKK